jgi:hypothetical protein
MKPSTAAAKIPDWQAQLRGAWPMKVSGTIISSVDNVSLALKALVDSGAHTVTLLFSHP